MTSINLTRFLLFTAVASLLAIAASPASAALITDPDIVPIPDHATGSGNGTLDLILFTESSGGAGNSAGSFNGDNANTQMPTGSGQTTANESYITSMGEIRDFYRLNFPDGMGGSTVNQIVLFVDINETGGAQDITVDILDIVSDYTASFGDARDNPAGNDIASNVQNGTNAGFSGGTLQANLDGSKVLPYQNNGAGHADIAIFTGINPFSGSFSDSTRVLFHWASSIHDNGGETIFLSGEFAPQDLRVPEPASAALAFVAVGLGLAARRRLGRL